MHISCWMYLVLLLFFSCLLFPFMVPEENVCFFLFCEKNDDKSTQKMEKRIDCFCLYMMYSFVFSNIFAYEIVFLLFVNYRCFTIKKKIISRWKFDFKFVVDITDTINVVSLEFNRIK